MQRLLASSFLVDKGVCLRIPSERFEEAVHLIKGDRALTRDQSFAYAGDRA
jgi:hypothetical protein